MNKTTRIYLAGGMKGKNWQDEVIYDIIPSCFFDSENVPDIINPRENQSEKAEEYTSMDLYNIRRSDVIFAYYDDNNPSGYGMVLEIGYARSQDKLIIFVNKSDNKYMKIVEETADVVYDNIYDGLEYLKKII